jgi:hypothetical protein
VVSEVCLLLSIGDGWSSLLGCQDKIERVVDLGIFFFYNSLVLLLISNMGWLNGLFC